MTTVFTVVGVTNLIYTVLERDYGVPNPTGGGSLGSGITTTAGLTQAQVQAIVDAAVAGLPASGVTQAQVDAAVAAAIAAAPAGISQAQVEALIEVAAAKPVSGPLLVAAGLTAGVQGDTAEVVAFHPDNKPVNLALQAPGGEITVNGAKVQTEADVTAKVVDVLKFSPQIGSPTVETPRIKGTIYTPDGIPATEFGSGGVGSSWLTLTSGGGGVTPQIGVVTQSDSTLNESIRLRPRGQGAVEIGTATSSSTVKAVGDLTPDIDLVLEPQGDGKVKVKGSPVATEEYLAGVVGPAIQAAVASQVGKISDKLTLNVSDDDDSAFVVETNNLTGAKQKVGVDFVTQRDGQVTVNGKRVLTVDDALNPAGVDAAAIEAAIAPLTAELAKKVEKAYVDEQFANQTASLDQLSTDVGGALDQVRGEYTQLAEDIVQYSNEAFTGKAEFQALLDAMNGPDADIPMIANMFTLLNDVIMALLDATGVPVPEAAKDAAEALKQKQQDDMRLLITGGYDAPPDIDWTPCVKVAGAGVVQAKLTNGIAQLAGRLDYKQSNTGSYATVQKLPDGFPRPKTDIFRAAYAVNTNVSYRIALVRISPNGDIGVSAPTGVFDWLEFGGVQFPVF